MSVSPQVKPVTQMTNVTSGLTIFALVPLEHHVSSVYGSGRGVGVEAVGGRSRGGHLEKLPEGFKQLRLADGDQRWKPSSDQDAAESFLDQAWDLPLGIITPPPQKPCPRSMGPSQTINQDLSSPGRSPPTSISCHGYCGYCISNMGTKSS